MSELDAMLAAVRADPDDDTPRLIFADWLEEHATKENGYAARATFIRCQIELANTEGQLVSLFNDDADWDQCTELSARWCPNCGDCSCESPEDSMSDESCPLHWPQSQHCCKAELEEKRESLLAREQELWKANACDWLNNWTGAEQLVVEKNAAAVAFSTMPPGSIKYEFRRGFFSKASGTWEDLSQHLDAILDDPWVPGLDEVELTTEPEVETRDSRDGSAVVRLEGRTWRRFPSGSNYSERAQVLLESEWPKENVRSWKLPPEPRANPDPLPNGFFADLFSQEPAT